MPSFRATLFYLIISYKQGLQSSIYQKTKKKQRFTSNLHQLMQKSVQARKNRIISAMSGQSNRSCPFLKQTEIQIEI